jgi:2,3-bisphosphoglycerate-independent phosphoglycerate mutase
MDVGLVILDGWGSNPEAETRDAVRAAETPNFDRSSEAGAVTTIETHGRSVGLPEGQMGNSEVGHLTIGAGRIVTQESARITDALAAWRRTAGSPEHPSTSGSRRAPPAGDPAAATDPPLDENEPLQSAIEFAGDDGRVHLLGLVSDGGVHASQSHVHGLIDLVATAGGEAVVHAFTDGRDTPPRSGVDYLADLERHAESAGATIATVSGRYYAMDRDGNWDRTRRAYDAIVARDADHTTPTAVAAAEDSYERGDTDEFVDPTAIEGGPALDDGDAAIVCNFRADRARQLTRMLAGIDPLPAWGGVDPPAIRLVTMTEYDAGFDLPVVVPPRRPADTLGETLAAAGRTQLRLAETEKYAHVTYFLDGGREDEFDGEIREIVSSPDVSTYDRKPEMSAPEVTGTAIDVVGREDPDVAVVNYANPDMVGHTGDFAAAVAAVEAVDEQLGRLLPALEAAGAHVVLTADHGNADRMGPPDRPHTAHTTSPVPFVYLGPDGTAAGRRARDGGTLADVAPTVLALADVDPPPAMTGRPLVE